MIEHSNCCIATFQTAVTHSDCSSQEEENTKTSKTFPDQQKSV